jgi:hypothetical protein
VYSPLGVFMEPGRGLEHVIPFFAFAPGIRKMIYTTNAHHRARDRAAHQDAPAPVQRPRHDPPARRRRRHQDPGRQSHLPRDRHYRVSEERRHARKRRRNRDESRGLIAFALVIGRTIQANVLVAPRRASRRCLAHTAATTLKKGVRR